MISSFTTSIFIPISYKIPIILLDSDTQEFVEKWRVLDSLYNSVFYKIKIENIQNTISKIFDEKENKLFQNEKLIKNHWPTDSFNRFELLLNELVQQNNYRSK